MGNENITFLNLRNFRRAIGYVDRNPAIFSGTVRDNLHMSCPTATDSEMEELLKELGVWTCLEHGLDTVIKKGYNKLSGG